jgi:hypothetical protein
MPDVTLTSTTDSDADVQAALAAKSTAVLESPPAAPVTEPTPPTLTPKPEARSTTEPEPEPEPEATPEGEAEPEPKKPSKAQQRINELVRARYEAEGRTKAAQDRAAALEQQLAERQATPPTLVRPAPVADAGEPKPEDYETYEAFMSASIDYRAERIVQARLTTALAAEHTRQQAAEQTRAADQIRANYNERTADTRAQHADFDAVVGQDLPVSPVMEHVILTSEVGPEISYYLGQHPDECAALAAISGPDAIRAMGKLEARVEATLESAGTSPAPTPSRPSTSKAPPPITPVRAASTASTLDPEKMDYQQYKKYREDQERARGGRR